MTTLYHSDVGFPPRVRLPDKCWLIPSDHARDEASKNYRYKPFDIPDAIVFKQFDAHAAYTTGEGIDVHLGSVFEIEVEYGEVVKVGARVDYDDEYDITLIINTRTETNGRGEPEATLITCWLNRKDDTHDTLDEEQYEQPKQSA